MEERDARSSRHLLITRGEEMEEEVEGGAGGGGGGGGEKERVVEAELLVPLLLLWVVAVVGGLWLCRAVRVQSMIASSEGRRRHPPFAEESLVRMEKQLKHTASSLMQSLFCRTPIKDFATRDVIVSISPTSVVMVRILFIRCSPDFWIRIDEEDVW
jgi:hypothetical protein